MYTGLKSIGAALLGIIIGMALVSLLFLFVCYGSAPGIIYDGSYPFLNCLFFVPQGAWLGGLTGYAVSAVRRNKRPEAAAVLICGVLLFLSVPALFVYTDPTHIYPYEPSERWSQLGFYFGVTLFWAALMGGWAVCLLAKSPEPISD